MKMHIAHVVLATFGLAACRDTKSEGTSRDSGTAGSIAAVKVDSAPSTSPSDSAPPRQQDSLAARSAAEATTDSVKPVPHDSGQVGQRAADTASTNLTPGPRGDSGQIPDGRRIRVIKHPIIGNDSGQVPYPVAKRVRARP